MGRRGVASSSLLAAPRVEGSNPDCSYSFIRPSHPLEKKRKSTKVSRKEETRQKKKAGAAKRRRRPAGVSGKKSVVSSKYEPLGARA